MPVSVIVPVSVVVHLPSAETPEPSNFRTNVPPVLPAVGAVPDRVKVAPAAPTVLGRLPDKPRLLAVVHFEPSPPCFCEHSPMASLIESADVMTSDHFARMT